MEEPSFKKRKFDHTTQQDRVRSPRKSMTPPKKILKPARTLGKKQSPTKDKDKEDEDEEEQDFDKDEDNEDQDAVSFLITFSLSLFISQPEIISDIFFFVSSSSSQPSRKYRGFDRDDEEAFQQIDQRSENGSQRDDRSELGETEEEGSARSEHAYQPHYDDASQDESVKSSVKGGDCECFFSSSFSFFLHFPISSHERCTCS